MILNNMTFKTRRDEYSSGMHELKYLNEPSVQSVRAADVSYAAGDTMPVTISGTVLSWAERVSEREREVTGELEHHRLQIDLIEHLWSRRGSQ